MLLTTSLLYGGGAEQQVFQLALGLKERGWDVRVVTLVPLRTWRASRAMPDPPDTTLRHLYVLVDELDAAHVPATSLDMDRGHPNTGAVLALARLLQDWQPSVLHSHMVHANLLGRVVRPLHWVPVQISTAHNVNEGGRWREVAYRLTDPLCTLTTNVSRAGVERYVRVGAARASKISYMPNGVDTGRFRRDHEARARLRREFGFAEDQFVWLAAGRLTPAKDPVTLLRALAALRGTRPEAFLLLVGYGELLANCKALAEALGLDKHVRFLGTRDDLPALMNAADAYVLSSAWEGLPMVLLEAAASALPIVATNVGGNSEIVLDGESGLLVPPRRPDLLAEAMGRVSMLSASDRARMGSSGLAHSREEYSLEHVVDRWDSLYRELLRGAGVITT